MCIQMCIQSAFKTHDREVRCTSFFYVTPETQKRFPKYYRAFRFVSQTPEFRHLQMHILMRAGLLLT